MDKCCHDISLPNHTVNLLPRRSMAVPETIHGICIICHKPLTFIREQKHFVLKEVKDEDSGSNV